MKKQGKKKIIILEHSGGRLANQLWTFAAIFAYAKERGYEIENYSFIDYFKYFHMPHPNWWVKLLSDEKIRNNKFIMKFRLYRNYINFIRKTYPKQILDSEKTEQFYLPPSPFRKEIHQKQILQFENSETKILYMANWMFRNPVGIEKWRNEIVAYFRPSKSIEKNVSGFLAGFREKYKNVIGVHIRQGDYITWKNSKNQNLYFEQIDVRKILDAYLAFSNLEKDETVFILCSDGQIDKKIFNGLHITNGLGTPVEDIFVLSGTDCILGSDSTFGGFASYYGNIPFIIFEKPMIDWNYYQEELEKNKGYFENKKSTVIYY